MLIPIRCFTCGKELSSRWEEYTRLCSNTEDKAKVLDQLGLKRYCCRSIMLTTVDVMQKILKFEYPQESKEEEGII
ncbi:hypothetical protein NEFER03_0958 [Nematocida sp. LUAm3]|nr:hypothetical protein NEFER03_0958 [Nematocida sp. LUAm3]KAI5175284.1 hypothetical protein NEFER02_1213 [Nematocida sp. LUAm2]KAI5177609.1 hypothetical protein NEFER01_0833 [Nematocida sp. LUAm1]